MEAKSIIESLSKHQKNVMGRHLGLILTVFKNYDHVVELEQLLDLYNRYSRMDWVGEGDKLYDYTQIMRLLALIVNTSINKLYNNNLYTTPEYKLPENHINKIVEDYFPDMIKYHKSFIK